MLKKSMRANYEEYGVEKYYTLVGSSYRNPHFPAVRMCIFSWLDAWWRKEGAGLPEQTAVKILDMAAGSGEATICVKDWWVTRRQGTVDSATITPSPGSARQRLPVALPSPRPAFIPPSKVGRPAGGAASSVKLGENSPFPAILATDPYTVQAYKDRTGLTCHPLSFDDLASGIMPRQSSEESTDDGTTQEAQDTGNTILDMVICSFALHLVESPSQLFALLWELSTKAKWLIIISPHKKPEIKDSWGWDHWDVDTWARATPTSPFGILKDRVHCRVFRSCNFNDEELNVCHEMLNDSIFRTLAVDRESQREHS